MKRAAMCSPSLPVLIQLCLFQLSEVRRWHRERHRGQDVQTVNVDLSNDKVLETDRSKVSLNTFTIRFLGCKDVFAFLVFRPGPRYLQTFKQFLHPQKLIARVLQDVTYVTC
jgi:hypothetical protein